MMTRRQFVGDAALVGAAAGLGGAGFAAGEAVREMSLREVGAARGLLVGCSVAVDRLKGDPGYAALVKAQAGIVVAENDFKFEAIHPAMTRFSFRRADELVEFAEANGMKLRGHNFVWHRQLPQWFGEQVTRNNAEKVLVEHIERVGGRYAGKIHSWDVVNEAVYVDDGLPGGMRDSPWQRLLPGASFGDGAGRTTVPEYAELAFRTARKVDPKALLCYNDFGIEAENAWAAKKREAVLRFLRALQAKGVPVDALGVQSHLAAGAGEVYGPGLKAMIAEVRSMGLKVLVTEMDVNDRALGPEVGPRDAAVAEVYGSYLRTVVADPAVIAVVTWGITDKYTWLNHEDARTDGIPERALPFDSELKAKPAVAAMRRGIGSRGQGGTGAVTSA